MSNERKYVKSGDAVNILGVSKSTLRRMVLAGEMQYIKTNTGRYLYDVDRYIRGVKNTTVERKKICYARVSSRAQKQDLENQKDYLRRQFPDHEIISDYGSGLNFKRKGLLKILDLAYEGKLQEIVVTYKDRLCRFGFEIFEYILRKQSSSEIVVLCKGDRENPTSELTNDLLSIITVFSARMHGLRKYSNQIKEDKSLLLTSVQTDNETDDRDIQVLL